LVYTPIAAPNLFKQVSTMENDFLLHDLTCSSDIRALIDAFSQAVYNHEVLGTVFRDIFRDSMPEFCLFFEMLLIENRCRCQLPNSWPVGLKINAGNFSLLLELFEETIDLHFKGTMASLAKQKAGHMSAIFQNN
jgi:hypothetical protein